MGRIVKCVAQSGLNLRSLLSSRRACSTASCLDTHAVVKGLEAQGIPPNQSEALLKVLNETFVSKSDIHKSAELSDAQLSALKWEMKSTQSAGLLDAQLSALKWEMKSTQSAELSEKQLSALKWEMKSIQDSQLLALQQEQSKMQKELELKLEKLDMGIEMKDAELLARQEARMVALANDSDKGFYELNGRINATDAKWTAALEGIRAQIEGARYEVIKYCVGALMSLGGFVVAVMRMMPSSTKKEP